jgi:hypothetical protein
VISAKRTGPLRVRRPSTSRQWPPSPRGRRRRGFLTPSGRLEEHLAADTGSFVLSLYAVEYALRARMVMARLFPEAGEISSDPEKIDHEPTSLSEEMGEFLKAVARLDQLDPVLTELIRLRGARTHNCRVCQSTRLVAALRSGADESTFDKIDYYETSDLSDRSKTALRLTDAIITQPTGIDQALVDETRRHFSPVETVEIVLDVIRNSAQKPAVALSWDEPHVTEGVELYEIAADGDVTFLDAATAVS